MDFFQRLAEEFKQDFIEQNRWQYLLNGLGTTMLITVLALLLGLALGFIVAIVRSTHDKVCTAKGGHFFLRFGNVLSQIYLTVIRGTPTMVQLLIIYYVIFGSVNINKVVCAVLAFGINSGAYVAEIIRSGIMSIDNGQTEAGRSLGLNFRRTMTFIIMPQALKNVLPALGNEFIVLLKETSISGYIALQDLTRGGDIIRSQTYSAFMPLIAVALIYLLIVMGLSKLLSLLERRLAQNDKR